MLRWVLPTLLLTLLQPATVVLLLPATISPVVHTAVTAVVLVSHRVLSAGVLEPST